MQDLSGKQLGHYRVVAPLGQGGMATVYRAYQPSMDRYVAIKVLPPYFAHDASFAGRFQQEAKLLGKLQHPHILPVFDYGSAGEFTYIVMPLVETGTLSNQLAAGVPLPLGRIQQVIAQVAAALDFAHSLGIVHRDVKPSNILVDRQGNCLLSDFGIAKMVESTSAFTHTGGSVGTPAYMSPEQILATGVDGRSDVYSLGVVLYEMATGHPPFIGETPPAIFMKHLNDPLPPPRSINRDIPRSVERVILKALAKERDDRYATAGEMALALAEATGVHPVAAAVESTRFEPPPTGVAPVRRPKRRLPVWALGLLALAVVAVLGAAAYGLLSRAAGRDRSPTPSVPVAEGVASLTTAPSTALPTPREAPSTATAGPTALPSPTQMPAPTATPPQSPTPLPDIPSLNLSRPAGALYRRDLATPIGEPIDWPQMARDPRTLRPVGHLEVSGYALGRRTAQTSIELYVPPDADLLSIPLATALNGAVDETDSEAGVIITVADRTVGKTAVTYATNVMDTLLAQSFLHAFADVSPFRGRNVTLELTLLHPDACSGTLCTHDIDLYIGAVQFERLPDLCTQEADGAHVLYEYPFDPSPLSDVGCASTQPLYFIEASAGVAEPYTRFYGAGADRYELTVELPAEFELLDFTLHYGPRVESLRINETEIAPKAVVEAFPVHRATNNRVEETARYSFVNDNPAAVAKFFRPGANTVAVVVAADEAWEERTFSLYVRFLARGESDTP